MANRPRAARRPRSIKQIVPVFLAIIIGTYALLFAALYFAQRQLIFPGSVSQGSDEARLDPRNGAEVCTLTTPRLHYRVPAYDGKALLSDGTPDPEAAKRLTVLFFHGNGGSINDYQSIFIIFGCWVSTS